MKRGRKTRAIRRRSKLAQAIRSPLFRTRVLRDHRTYHRASAKRRTPEDDADDDDADDDEGGDEEGGDNGGQEDR